MKNKLTIENLRVIADYAEHLELPTSEILRKLFYGELLNVVDIEDWFRPFYWDPQTRKWYFDNEEVFSYIQLINRLNRTSQVQNDRNYSNG